MKIFVNGEETIIDVSGKCTLSDILAQIETTLPQGSLATEIKLNDKVLDGNWTQNVDNIYILEEDLVSIKIEDSADLAREALYGSKIQFQSLLEHFEEIADAFRMQEDNEANTKFIYGIENMQLLLKVLEEASFLIGRPIENLKDGDISFQQYLDDLGEKLDKIITIQSQKDWVMLADLIEYEMLPALKNVGVIYRILEI